MPTSTFTWKPDLGAQRSVKPNVETIKFGDGYEQRISRGLNLMPKTWDVKFSRPISEAGPILNFLEAQAGLVSFNWTDPMGVSGVYVCKQWQSAQEKFGLYVVSCRFEQVFEY